MNASRLIGYLASGLLALFAEQASALSLPATLNAVVSNNTLVVAGTATHRDTFLALMVDDICVAGSLDVYRATPALNADFRAYSCHTVASAGAGSTGAILGLAANRDVVVFYRAEGGGGWGAYPIAQRRIEGALFSGIKSLDVNVCSGASAIVFFPPPVNANLPLHDCPLGGTYQLIDDANGAGGGVPGLIDRQTQLGVGDEEPRQYRGVNNPSLTTNRLHNTAAITAQMATGLAPSTTTSYGQVYSMIVNNSAVGASDEVISLAKPEVTGILTGTITDWCTIRPTIADCGIGGSHPITVVVRQPGAGAQIAATVEYLGCCSPLTMVSDSDPPGAADTDGVILAMTGDVAANTVAATVDAIGFELIRPTLVPNTKLVNIGNVVPSNANFANLSYQFGFEATLTKNPVTTDLQPASVNMALADAFIALSRNANKVPGYASIFGIPNAINLPGTIGARGLIVALCTRNGDSCRICLP